MRLLFTLIILHLSFIICRAQSGEWTWVNGDTVFNSYGSYGLQGVPSPTNAPSARYACAYWTDTAGNFWIYGGLGESSDLWKFDPNTVMWTWMAGDSLYMVETINASRGVYDPQNTPGYLGYGMFTWVTRDNHLWMYGGSTVYARIKADLWQYDPGINQWAWMGNFGPLNYGTKGSGNTGTMPGARDEGNSAWTDSSDNLWFFGGSDSVSHSYNDVWVYNITSGIWTWMSGSSNPDDTGSYGTIGQPSVINYPSARWTNLFWKDSQGKFWIAGGTQYTNDLMYQDIWNFNPKTLQWTWVKGPKGEDTSMTGASCTPGISNQPGPRYENRADWKICDDLIITSGGTDDWKNNVSINDLWAYKVSWNEWTKINSWPVKGSYGARGVTNSVNYPPFRSGSVGFKDKNNNLWMFAGGSFGGTHQNLIGLYNDLWKFSMPVCVQTSLSSGIDLQVSDSSICLGDTVLLTVSGGVMNMRIAPLSNVSFQDSIHILLSPDSSTQYTITGSTGCRTNDTTGLFIYVSRPGIFNYLLSDTQICRGNSITLSTFKMTGISITPSTSVKWLDSTDALLQPDSTTIYVITGSSPACKTSDTTVLPIQVTQPAPYSLTLTDSVHCPANNSDTLRITGLTHITISPLSDVRWIDSSDAALNPLGTIAYKVSGVTSCGSAYSSVVNFYLPFDMATAYTINKNILCTGDTAILTLLGVKNASITPAGSVMRLDSMHYLLYPDTATSYKIRGIVNCSGLLDSTVVPVAVSRPGIINYRIGATQICNGDGDSLFIYNVSNLQFSPPTFLSTGDSLNYRAYLFQPAGLTTYVITGQNGCGVNDTATLTVNSSPFPTFALAPSINSNNSVICKGDSVALTITNLSQITFSQYDSSITIVDSDHYYLHPGINYSYLVSGINCRNEPANNYFTIQVKPQSVISYTLSDSIICSGSSALLTLFNISSASTIPSYHININGTTGTTSFSPQSTTNFEVIANGVCGEADTINLTIRVAGQSSFALSAQSVCRGDSALLTLTNFVSAQLNPATGVSKIDSLHYYLYPDSTTTFKITGQSLCSGAYNDSVTISVSAPLVYINVDSSTLCALAGVTVCATTGYPHYAWSSGQSTACISAPVGGVYDVTVTSQNTCTAESNVLNIIPYTLPSPPINGFPTTICADDSTQLCAPAGFASYQWNPGVTGTGRCIEAMQAGDYYVTVTDTSGCSAESNHLLISVYPVPSVSIVVQGDTLASYGQVSYQWYLNNHVINGATSNIYITKEPGEYTVEVTDTNGCTTFSTPFTVTGISELQEDESVILYPNPSSVSSWQLAVSSELVGSALEVFDDEGRLVFQSKISLLKSKIDLDVAKGVYWLRISNERVSVVRKLVKI